MCYRGAIPVTSSKQTDAEIAHIDVVGAMVWSNGNDSCIND